MCRRRESNSHGFPRWVLNPVRLPFRHSDISSDILYPLPKKSTPNKVGADFTFRKIKSNFYPIIIKTNPGIALAIKATNKPMAAYII